MSLRLQIQTNADLLDQIEIFTIESQDEGVPIDVFDACPISLLIQLNNKSLNVIHCLFKNDDIRLTTGGNMRPKNPPV
jgi:hypothetical protein